MSDTTADRLDMRTSNESDNARVMAFVHERIDYHERMASEWRRFRELVLETTRNGAPAFETTPHAEDSGRSQSHG